jgi:hypothetical protein
LKLTAGSNPGSLSEIKYKMIESKYITVKEYAERHSISVKTVYNQIDSGKIDKKRVKKVLNITLIKV